MKVYKLDKCILKYVTTNLYALHTTISSMANKAPIIFIRDLDR